MCERPFPIVPILSPFVVMALAVACAPVAEASEREQEPAPPAKVYEPIEGGSFVVGPDRPVTVFVPDSYDPMEALPLVLLLHGYGVTGAQMDSVLGFRAFANDNRFITAYPDGTIDSDGSTFWNATETCCDFEGTGVDDSAFLRSVVEEAQDTAHIDPARIFVLGHSNGGFMAQRLGCDHADLFSVVVSIAGATTTQDTCAPSEGIAVLAVHGTNDGTIAYDGGQFGPGLRYPSAPETAAAWAARNACAPDPVDGGALDLETIAGEETRVQRFVDCEDNGAVELWTVSGGTHVPRGNADYLSVLLDFMTTHAR